MCFHSTTYTSHPTCSRQTPHDQTPHRNRSRTGGVAHRYSFPDRLVHHPQLFSTNSRRWRSVTPRDQGRHAHDGRHCTDRRNRYRLHGERSLQRDLHPQRASGDLCDRGLSGCWIPRRLDQGQARTQPWSQSPGQDGRAVHRSDLVRCVDGHTHRRADPDLVHSLGFDRYRSRPRWLVRIGSADDRGHK